MTGVGVGRLRPAARRRLTIWAMAPLLAIVLACSREDVAATPPPDPSSLSGSMIVASPRLVDPNFSRAVVLIVSHDRNGAFGLVVNRILGEGPLAALLGDEAPPAAAPVVRVHAGGPVERGKGFVLHSPDYRDASTVPAGDGVALSTTRDAFEAIARGGGPRRAVVLLGYAGWGPGQLESEIDRGDWLLTGGDPELVFSDDAGVWDRALRIAGLPL